MSFDWLSHYPKTYQPSHGAAEIFDPSLKQFARAFRVGEPTFDAQETRRRWYAVRCEVIDALLTFISNSRWRNHLVLRGSLLMQVWSDAAREPGDIDWVFTPAATHPDDSDAVQLFNELRQTFERESFTANALVLTDKIATDEIWTYERAEGRRIVFPWEADGLPNGSVQMDVVFNERLWDKPVLTPIRLGDGTEVLLEAASKELSLAWKLLWLETDMYPQGKDLYDAVLLAEQTRLPLQMLVGMLQEARDYYSKNALSSEFPLDLEVDWDNFKLEYPAVAGTAQEWQMRLTKALRPAFEDYRQRS